MKWKMLASGTAVFAVVAVAGANLVGRVTADPTERPSPRATKVTQALPDPPLDVPLTAPAGENPQMLGGYAPFLDQIAGVAGKYSDNFAATRVVSGTTVMEVLVKDLHGPGMDEMSRLIEPITDGSVKFVTVPYSLDELLGAQNLIFSGDLDELHGLLPTSGTPDYANGRLILQFNSRDVQSSDDHSVVVISPLSGEMVRVAMDEVAKRVGVPLAFSVEDRGTDPLADAAQA